MTSVPRPPPAELLEIARATAYEIASQSARSNITDGIAAKAVEQYLVAIDSGEEIRNPHGWIRTTARRRAIDAMRKWSRDKKRRVRLDVQDVRDDPYLTNLSNNLLRAVDEGSTQTESRLWLDELINSTIPDPTNRTIAVRCLVDGDKPGEVAGDLGLDAASVSSRLARIKERLRSEITIDDLRR